MDQRAEFYAERLRSRQIPAIGRTTKNYKLVLQGGNFDPNVKILINDREAGTEFVSQNELRGDLPSGKFGGIGRMKVQAVIPNGQKTNSLYY